MSERHEQFVSSYLRLNGYFTVPNFIVHAADDPARIVAGSVGNYTELDVLGVRMPYSVERTSHLKIVNDPVLVEGADGRYDIVMAEVKSGGNNKPNAVWRQGNNNYPLEYLVRFVGFFPEESEMVTQVARELANEYRSEGSSIRFRYIVFASKPNEHYENLGVQYMTFSHMTRFLIEGRGQCWIEHALGIASSHPQWDPLMREMFAIANDQGTPFKERQAQMLALLS